MEKYLTVEDLQKILGFGKNKTYDLVNRADFPKIKIGRRILIPESEFELYMKRKLYKRIDI